MTLFRNDSPGALTLEQAIEIERKREAKRRQARGLPERWSGEYTETANAADRDHVGPVMQRNASGLFRNDSPGALTLDQAVELEMKRRDERRRQAALQKEQAAKQAAQPNDDFTIPPGGILGGFNPRRNREYLARFGRGHDTEIAHVARGELVIPAELQTPEVLAFLTHVAAARNVPLGRLRVGSARNSINPHTGAPEFSYDGPEVAAARQSPGQQVADLYVNQFPNEANGFGHVGIGVNTDQTQGFYPQHFRALTPSGVDVPGSVKNDDMSQPHNTLRIPTTPRQDAAVEDYIGTRQMTPGQYELYNRQCTEFVAGALRAAGIAVPSDTTWSPLDNMIPNKFFPLLKRNYQP